MRLRRIAGLGLVAATIAGTAAGADDEGEDVGGALPWRPGPATIFLRRIVDASTGAPIVGATVQVFPEVPHPEPGFGVPAATATSDAEGWARIESSALDAGVVERYGPPTWSFVDAKGFAPAGEMAALVPGLPPVGGTDWEIVPGETVRIALVDPLDRPVPGVLVGWLFGCGHTPDERQARTGPDGIAVFESASTDPDGRFWPLADGLRALAGYVETPYAAGEVPRVERLVWSQSVEGQILDAEGEPAAGIAVGVPSWHRGPWTRTDRQGRFRLVGSEVRTGEAVLVEAGEYPVGPKAPERERVSLTTFPAPPPGRRAVVRLRRPGEDSPDPPAEPNVVVVVARPSWPVTDAETSTTVVLARESDGWTASQPVDGSASFAAFPGTYEVQALATAQGGVVHARATSRVVVPETGTARVQLDLPAPAVQSLQIHGSTKPSFDEIALVAEGASTPIPVEAPKAVDILVPPGVDTFLRVTQGARTRLVPLESRRLAPGARAPVVRVEPFPAVVAGGRLVDEAGNPIAGWLVPAREPRPGDEERPTGIAASETPSATIAPELPLRLVAWPRDDDRLAPRFVEVPEPKPGADPVDLGSIRIASRPPPLTIRRPLRGSTEIDVRITRRGRSVEYRLGLDAGPKGDVARILDPWWRPGLLGEGSVVRIAPDSTEDRATAPIVRPLEGAGPWTIEIPTGVLEILPSDERGAALADWTVQVDRVLYAGGGPRLEIAALETGPHEVVVDAKGRVPRRIRVTLTESEHRSWKPILRAEAAPPR